MAKRKQKIIQNPELLAALKGFIPSFGNDEDINILTQVMNVSKKLEEIDNKILRSGKDLSQKMKDILFEERTLIERIIKRNMDF